MTILYITLTVNRALFFFSFQLSLEGVSHSTKIVCAWLLTNPVYFWVSHDGSFNWTAPHCTLEHKMEDQIRFVSFCSLLEIFLFCFSPHLLELFWPTRAVRGNSVKSHYFDSLVLKSLLNKHVIFQGGNGLSRKKAGFNGQMLSGIIEFWFASPQPWGKSVFTLPFQKSVFTSNNLQWIGSNNLQNLNSWAMLTGQTMH